MEGGKSSSAVPPPRPSPAVTTRSFTLCNKTTKGTLSSAVAYETTSGWQAFGWYLLEQGACRTFTQVAGDRVLYFANDNTTLRWSGGHPHLRSSARSLRAGLQRHMRGALRNPGIRIQAPDHGQQFVQLHQLTSRGGICSLGSIAS
jgi:hypothetical protein